MSVSAASSNAYDHCCCPCSCEPETTRLPDGRVQFENENYQITVNDRGEVRIFNKNTQEFYRVWGDPHVDVDGKRAFDFWGQTTFQLEDGTKVTIETTPWRGNENMTISSKVTITDGDYGVHITGVDDNCIGDLAFQEVEGAGLVMDLLVRDGNTIYENAWGSGFLGVDSDGNITQVNQQFINETDELKADQLGTQLGELLTMFSGIVSIAFAGAFMSSLGSSLGELAAEKQSQQQFFPVHPLFWV